MADSFYEPSTLGELVEKLGPDEGIIAEFPNGYKRYLCRHSHLDKSDAARPIVKPYKYDWLSKTYHVKIAKYKMDLCDVFQRYIETCNNKKITIKPVGDSYDEYFKIKRIICNGPATIIFWNDGTKTIVKAQEEIDDEKGILYAALKKLATKKEYNDILRAIDKTDKACKDSFSIPKFPFDEKQWCKNRK
jgi:hypothetical protein